MEVETPEAEASVTTSGNLTFQAISQAGGVDRMGNPVPQVTRTPGTAKLADTVTATLTPEAPTPPKGTLKSWKITSATLTYPKRNPKFTFGTPLPPVGTTTINMSVSGYKTTASFREDWAMDGMPVYSILLKKTMCETPKNYRITAKYTIEYTYEWEKRHHESGTDEKGIYHPGETWYETITETRTVNGTATGNLLINGSGVNSKA